MIATHVEAIMFVINKEDFENGNFTNLEEHMFELPIMQSELAKMLEENSPAIAVLDTFRIDGIDCIEYVGTEDPEKINYLMEWLMNDQSMTTAWAFKEMVRNGESIDLETFLMNSNGYIDYALRMKAEEDMDLYSGGGADYAISPELF